MNFLDKLGEAMLQAYDYALDARDAYNTKVKENHKQLIRGSVLDPTNHPNKD